MLFHTLYEADRPALNVHESDVSVNTNLHNIPLMVVRFVLFGFFRTFLGKHDMGHHRTKKSMCVEPIE